MARLLPTNSSFPKKDKRVTRRRERRKGSQLLTFFSSSDKTPLHFLLPKRKKRVTERKREGGRRDDNSSPSPSASNKHNEVSSHLLADPMPCTHLHRCLIAVPASKDPWESMSTSGVFSGVSVIFSHGRLPWHRPSTSIRPPHILLPERKKRVTGRKERKERVGGEMTTLHHLSLPPASMMKPHHPLQLVPFQAKLLSTGFKLSCSSLASSQVALHRSCVTDQVWPTKSS